MPRLISISFRESPGIPGIRPTQLQSITIGATGLFQNWTFALRGPRMLIVSPEGWQPSEYGERTTGRRVYEVARDVATLTWEYAPGEPIDNVKDYTAEPVKTAAAVVEPVTARALIADDPDEPSTLKRKTR